MIDIIDFFSNISIELFTGILALLSGVAANAFAEYIIPQLRKRFSVEDKKEKKTYREQIEQLTENLTKASSEVDKILREMADVGQQREIAVAKLEHQLGTLTEREKELQEKINTLEKVPLPAIEYFANIVEKGEKKSAWRDYALFGLGVLVSTVIAIILRLFGI